MSKILSDTADGENVGTNGRNRGGFSISSTSSRTLSKFHRFVSENKIIMIIMKMRFMMKRIINDFQPVALPGDFI